jgi:hypothetical protein
VSARGDETEEGLGEGDSEKMSEGCTGDGGKDEVTSRLWSRKKAVKREAD